MPMPSTTMKITVSMSDSPRWRLLDIAGLRVTGPRPALDADRRRGARLPKTIKAELVGCRPERYASRCRKHKSLIGGQIRYRARADGAGEIAVQEAQLRRRDGYEHAASLGHCGALRVSNAGPHLLVEPGGVDFAQIELGNRDGRKDGGDRDDDHQFSQREA